MDYHIEYQDTTVGRLRYEQCVQAVRTRAGVSEKDQTSFEDQKKEAKLLRKLRAIGKPKDWIVEVEKQLDGLPDGQRRQQLEKLLDRMRKDDDPRVAERFELYVCGLEIANAFGELTDPAEQRRRFEAEMAEKQRVHGERYPIDEDFLAALAQMPPASGIALGFDRLVMLATGATRIDQVLWTPMPQA